MIEKAVGMCGFNIKWEGSGVDEVGYNEKTGQAMIFISEKYYRPAEVDILLGDSTKARTVLGWKPKTSFNELIKLMVDNDTKYVMYIS
jgi:GDPmannose 4,6-dehydratase